MRLARRAAIVAAWLGLTVGTARSLRAAEPSGATATTRSATTAPTSAPTTAPLAAATSRPTAATTQAAAPNPAIEAAIRGLSADSWRERQAAQDALARFGEEAIPRLRQLDKAADEEVRTRAASALRQIAENALLGGSLITLKVKDAKPQDVFAEIARQARTEFPTFPPNLWDVNRRGVSVTLDADRAPFWTTFKRACDQAGVFPQPAGSDQRMTLSQGTNTLWNGPSVVRGPFLVVANRISRSNSVELANPKNVQHSFDVNFTVFAEPKVRVIQSSYAVRIDEAVDDKGNSLAPNAARNPFGMSSGNQWQWHLNARLEYPADPGRTIARLRGAMRFLVQTKSETLDVPDVLSVKNLTRTVANRRMLIKEVRKSGDTFEVEMTLYRDRMDQQDWAGMHAQGYAIRLLDKAGRALSSRGMESSGSDNEIHYKWRFGRDAWGDAANRPGDPHRLVWEIPTETRDMDATFEFKDLPIP